MYRFLEADKDTYITNKVIANSFRATDANVGEAGTLDLFKLFDESSLPGSSSNVTELSRILVKFDLDPLRNLTGSILDINDDSFRCEVNLIDVLGGQTLPSNFNIIMFPLARIFDEGIGRDISTFGDLDAANFFTASYTGGVVRSWVSGGANALGGLGDTQIDIIGSGNLNDGNGVVNLWREQSFSEGSEDFLVDVTPIVSATIAGIIPDFGYRISFKPSQENDTRTYFVKRFGSRHSCEKRIRPRIIVKYNDSVMENSENFFFDLSGSIYLNNFHRGQPANILSGTSLTEITGADSLNLVLTFGSFSKTVLASQCAIGGNLIDGKYKADFAIASQDLGIVSGSLTLADYIVASGSLTFGKEWQSLDGTVTYFSSSQVISPVIRNSFREPTKNYFVSVPNAKPFYKSTQRVRFRVHVHDPEENIFFKKLPLERKSLIFTEMFYRIRDINNNDILIPFETVSNATKLSTDSEGMYFDLYMEDLDIGRVYAVDLLVREGGEEMIFDDAGARFRVDP